MEIEQLYREYRGKVFSYIRSRVSSYADAEDICSDVFEKVQLKIDAYDETKARPGTWIYTITRNSVIDYYRRQKPSAELDEDLADEKGIDDKLLNEENLSLLAASLKKLPEQLREIIVLRYYDNKPLTEVAKILGLSYGAVKLRHNNALEMLREAMN